MLRKRITETVHFAEFSLKLLHILFFSLEALTRRNQKATLNYFFKCKTLKRYFWFSPFSTY